MSERSRVDTTSAEDKSIGFDFQYYYFLNELLNLKSGQAAGLEVQDDVHIDRADGTTLLVQLKHTVQKNASGDAINLTNLDVDLWKSISNWCLVIIDKTQSRADAKSQLAFLRNTSFLLASNKSHSKSNLFLESLSQFKAEAKTHKDLIGDINAIRASTKDETIQEYIDQLLSLDAAVSGTFLKKLSFALNIDEIIDLCKTSIAEKQIDASRIDDVFRAVDSELRANSYETVRSRQKIIISFENFNRKYRRYFDIARSSGLLIRKNNTALPADLSAQIFIRQLIDIEDTHGDELDLLAKYTASKLQFRTNIERWIQDGDITQSDIEEMEQEAEAVWFTHFRSNYPGRQPTTDEAASGRVILKEMRLIKLSLASESLPPTISHGGIYELSDRPIIGWLYNWKDLYIEAE